MGSSWCPQLPVLFALLLILVEAVTPSNGGGPVKDCEARISKCESRMAPSRMRPVCGSNNQTYSSRCALLRAHCLLGDVTLKHRGRCRERQPCWARQSKDDGAACLPDGRFAPVQCHRATGYCWCVTPRGRPIPNTSRKNRKPKCKKRAKTRRGSESRGRKQNKECSRVDRSAFVNNIVRIFSTEFQRAVTDHTGEEEDQVLQWKFNSLDVDHSGWLNRDEYAELRRLVRKVVRPKRCARTFAKHCDLDRDLRITRQEWNSCLSLHLNPDSEDELTDVEGEDGFGVLQESSASLMQGEGGGGGGGGGMHSLLGEEVDHREEPEANNCLTDQKTALDEQKLVSLEMYVPECTPDGRYRKVQCYKSTGYCWCVQEDSGKPIPGTSIKDLHPKCDAIPTPSRPMKGCPEYKKQVFLKDLMEFLMHTMATQKGSSNETSTTPPNDLDEDQIATWNFVKLDTNKNKVLEKKEWKMFRVMISTHRKLRQCGRKLPRYCDVNHDRKVSMTEWINCLNATKTKVVNVTTDTIVSSTASPRRRGINPLDRYLKED